MYSDIISYGIYKEKVRAIKRETRANNVIKFESRHYFSFIQPSYLELTT